MSRSLYDDACLAGAVAEAFEDEDAEAAQGGYDGTEEDDGEDDEESEWVMVDEDAAVNAQMEDLLYADDAAYTHRVAAAEAEAEETKARAYSSLLGGETKGATSSYEQQYAEYDQYEQYAQYDQYAADDGRADDGRADDGRADEDRAADIHDGDFSGYTTVYARDNAAVARGTVNEAAAGVDRGDRASVDSTMDGAAVGGDVYGIVADTAAHAAEASEAAAAAARNPSNDEAVIRRKHDAAVRYITALRKRAADTAATTVHSKSSARAAAYISSLESWQHKGERGEVYTRWDRVPCPSRRVLYCCG